MTIRLKDKELQKKLDEISDGDFSRQLKEGALKKVPSPFDPGNYYQVHFGEGFEDVRLKRFSAWFSDDETEEVPEYYPNGWNLYPTVKPPKGKLFFLWVTTKDLRSVPMAGRTFKDSDKLFVWEQDRWVPAVALNVVTMLYKEVE